MGNYTEDIHIIFDSNKMLSIKIKNTREEKPLLLCWHRKKQKNMPGSLPVLRISAKYVSFLIFNETHKRVVRYGDKNQTHPQDANTCELHQYIQHLSQLSVP